MIRRRMIVTLAAVAVAGPAMGVPRNGDAGYERFESFEGATYDRWTAIGDAFGPGPARGTLPNQQRVTGYRGRGLVNTYRRGDDSRGTLNSPEFVIRRPYITFLIGGGARAGHTCMNLIVEGAVVRTATGLNDERLLSTYWDVSDLIGKPARLEIVDRTAGRWGHINVDEIHFSDTTDGGVFVTEKLYQETYRPQFHFTPARNWTNDPNGLVFHEGRYHLFFQHNPFGIEWGNMTWGHATSRDLVHWEQQPNAIEPDSLGTIFSGSAVVDHSNTTGFGTGDRKPIVAIFTYAGGTSPESEGKPFTQAIAWSVDGGKTFRKYEGNPVLGHIIGGNRDPKVIWHEPTHRWIMILYLDGSDYGLFASPDLKKWEHLQTFVIPDTSECPDFFELPVVGTKGKTRWVAMSANGQYLLGRFDGKRFTPESGPHPSDMGANFYAVQTYSDMPDRRRVQIAWMNGGRYPDMPFNQQMSFPAELTLRNTSDGLRLFRWPVHEIESLRRSPRRWSNLDLRPGQNPLSEIEGDLFDLEMEMEAGDAGEIVFTLRGVEIRYNPSSKEVSFLNRTGRLEPVNGRIRLRILLDRTSIELFGSEGRLSMTSCFLPDPDDRRLAIETRGGSARIVSMTAWPLKSIWP